VIVVAVVVGVVVVVVVVVAVIELSLGLLGLGPRRGRHGVGLLANEHPDHPHQVLGGLDVHLDPSQRRAPAAAGLDDRDSHKGGPRQGDCWPQRQKHVRRTRMEYGLIPQQQTRVVNFHDALDCVKVSGQSWWAGF
jgi:hypothetical protein